MKKPLPYIIDHSKRTRVRFIRFCILFGFFGILVRLFYWQVLRSESLRAIAQSQYNSVQKTTGSRGKIFTSDGYPLATNQDVYTLFAEPKHVERSSQEIASLLAPLLSISSSSGQLASEASSLANLESEWRQTLLSRLQNATSNWVSLKRKLSKEGKEKIEGLGLKGLGFDREEMRFYPEASMAAQILGFVGNDEIGSEQGYFGIEGLYDRELRGKVGVIKQEKDAAGIPIALGDYNFIDSQNGRDIILTIRHDLQFMLEEKLKQGMVRYGSKTAEAIIMDPKTGAILAMASYPNYDPTSFYQFDPQLYKNPLVSDVYEPGSTMKIFTVSAGIDTGAITPDTQCDRCAGPRTISGYTIKTWNDEYHPNTTITEGLVHSDNTAMIFTAEHTGSDKFVEYLKKFGFDEKTGIDLQEEAQPPFRDRWKDIDVATGSFGQGIGVTGIQMLRVAQTIANHGWMVKPTLVKEVKDGEKIIPVQPKTIRQVITDETAQKVTLMMEQAAAHGDAKWALPRGYRIAGKTGTAQVPVAGHYDETKTVASFIGFAPIEDPKFVMLVKLREPQTSPWGSETAAPLWFSIARELFLRMNIAPSQ